MHVMNLTKITALALPIFLCSCSGRYSNVIEYPSHQGDAIVVIKRGFTDTVSYKDKESNLLILDKLEGVLGIIDDVKWSPDGDYVLIESYGEGNQWISIYDTDAIKTNDENSEISESRYLDPYLHQLTQITWVANNKISFLSPGDFSQFDFELRRGKIDSNNFDQIPNAHWLWDVSSDTFTRAP